MNLFSQISSLGNGESVQVVPLTSMNGRIVASAANLVTDLSYAALSMTVILARGYVYVLVGSTRGHKGAYER